MGPSLIGRLLCRLGFHKWGREYRLILTCERDGCFAERIRRNA